jgi:hypothetical protein
MDARDKITNAEGKLTFRNMANPKASDSAGVFFSC